MAEFYHPYQFIPVKKKITDTDKTNKVDYEKIKSGDSGTIRHDFWVKDAYHGRLICKLHLVTPTVVGGQHKKTDESSATEVEPYRYGDDIAISGNSLRGMIGNVVEILSQSALRVLEDKRYSVRKKPGDGSLSAIGILRKKEDEKDFELLPLTLPVLSRKKHDKFYRVDEKWQRVFKENIPPLRCCLPVYIDGYQTNYSKQEQELVPNSFLGKNIEKGLKVQCFHLIEASAKKAYYALLENESTEKLSDCISTNTSGLREKTQGNKVFLLGQKIAENSNIEKKLPSSEMDSLQKPCQSSKYVRGILRILGIKDREKYVPFTKKHELFIPYHTGNRLSVPSSVIENFKVLAQERNKEDKSLPYIPQNYKSWKPESGQIVFFDIEENSNGEIQVSEISFSSIWRKAVDGSTYDFFKKIDSDLLPWGNERNALTPAEYLFGVVEEQKRPQDKTSRSLASRVRFSDGLPLEKVKPLYSEPKLLKILSSPKTPCPAMYFHPSSGSNRFIKKTDLNKKEHLPNGRKVYLHHQTEDINKKPKKPWETSNPDDKSKNQKMSCCPMQAGQDFYFHIDFDNLSEDELNLLLSSLNPTDDFQHRLGLGKSLGLGSVKIAIEGLFLIDRTERYTPDSLDKPRYSQVFCDTEYKGNTFPKWHKLYHQEAEALKSNHQDCEKGKLSQFKQKHHCAELIDDDTLKILSLVGNPKSLKSNISVKPPLLVGQNEEGETFKWFVKNEENKDKNADFGHQALPEIKPDDKKLKPLKQLKE